MAAKHLNILIEVNTFHTLILNIPLIQYIKTTLPHHIEKDTCLSFTFQDRNGSIVLALNEKQEYSFNGWSIIPQLKPPRVRVCIYIMCYNSKNNKINPDT